MQAADFNRFILLLGDLGDLSLERVSGHKRLQGLVAVAVAIQKLS